MNEIYKGDLVIKEFSIFVCTQCSQKQSNPNQRKSCAKFSQATKHTPRPPSARTLMYATK